MPLYVDSQWLKSKTVKSSRNDYRSGSGLSTKLWCNGIILKRYSATNNRWKRNRPSRLSPVALYWFCDQNRGAVEQAHRWITERAQWLSHYGLESIVFRSALLLLLLYCIWRFLTAKSGQFTTELFRLLLPAGGPGLSAVTKMQTNTRLLKNKRSFAGFSFFATALAYATRCCLCLHVRPITLRAKYSGAVYCYRSCLWRAEGRAGGRAVFVAGGVCYHDNSKLRASIFTKLGL